MTFEGAVAEGKSKYDQFLMYYSDKCQKLNPFNVQDQL